VPNSPNLKFQDGGNSHLEFPKKMSITPDSIKTSASSFMEDAQQPCGDDHVEKSKPKVNSNSAEEIHSVATINNVETSHLTINWFCVVLAD